MRTFSYSIFLMFCSLPFLLAATSQPDAQVICRKAFVFKTDEFAVASPINICLKNNVPVGYQATLNMAVCDDKLCANVYLKMTWDLAGNFAGFDTLQGKPLTKFDHKRFTDADYRKLDQILKDRNSMLRVLSKNELVDKSVVVKSATVDAVTGATPATVKKAVVDGAVYSSYALWHMANGAVRDSIRAFTLRNYSGEVVFNLIDSENFETQIFALKRLSVNDFLQQFDRLLIAMPKSSPVVSAYIITKLLSCKLSHDQQLKLVKAISGLDGYSKSIFIDRIIAEKELAVAFFPLVSANFQLFDERLQNKFMQGIQKLEIQEFKEQIKLYLGTTNEQ